MELKRYLNSEAFEKFPLDKEMCLGCEVWEVEEELREEVAQRQMAEDELGYSRMEVTNANDRCTKLEAELAVAQGLLRETATMSGSLAADRDSARSQLAEATRRLSRVESALEAYMRSDPTDKMSVPLGGESPEYRQAVEALAAAKGGSDGKGV